MLQEYPELAKRALEALIPFSTTHLCEAAMSALVDIKLRTVIALELQMTSKFLSAILTLVLMRLFQRDKSRGHTVYSFMLCFAE